MSYQHLRTAYPRAAKSHHCVWCNQEIPTGEMHVLEVGKFEGDFQSGRWHPECQRKFSEQIAEDPEADTFDPGTGERPAILPEDRIGFAKVGNRWRALGPGKGLCKSCIQVRKACKC